MSHIITLVTDFGFKDFYAGALKGALLKENTDVQLVDICHEITAFDVVESAFVLKNAYHYFPEKTLHIVCVNDRPDAQTRHLVIKHDEHLFIGPDNGIFNIAFEGEPELAYELERFRQPVPSYAGMYSMLAQAAKFVLGGGNIKDLGKPVFEIRKAMTFEPIVRENGIQGAVVYIDSFGNAVINIKKALFEKVGNERSFTISFRRSERIQEIRNDYFEVPEGERLCIFNAQGYLEIAINKGIAGSRQGLLGLLTGDDIQIEFT